MRSASSVAVLSDVHGNATALEAVLREVEAAQPELLVFGGDLTWGPLPEETRRLVEPLDPAAIYVRGNAERALLEAAEGIGDGTPRSRWMAERHEPSTIEFVRSFVEGASVDVDGLGPVRFCHGSPRSDEELITFATPESRIMALLEGVEERVLVSAHTHLQFDRRVAGIRSINPGSVGMAYEGVPGVAFWALLGPEVSLRRTPFDLDEAVRRYRATDDPAADLMVEVLTEPPTREEAAEHAEAREFAG